jgi:hypothetical protein
VAEKAKPDLPIGDDSAPSSRVARASGQRGLDLVAIDDIGAARICGKSRGCEHSRNDGAEKHDPYRHPAGEG